MFKDLMLTLLRQAANSHRRVRRWYAMAMDLLLCLISVWISLSLRLGEWVLIGRAPFVVTAAAIAFWIPISRWRRIYASLIRYSGGRTMAGLAVACAFLAVPMTLIFAFIGIPGVPRTLALLHPIIFFLLLAVSRMAVRFVLTEILNNGAWGAKRKNVAIYGSGSAGKQLALALTHEPQVRVAAFLDDDKALASQVIDGVPVYSAKDIGPLIESLALEEIFLALPSASVGRRREIVASLAQHSVHVRSLPSFSHLIDGKITLSDLREIEVEELLGRDPVAPQAELLETTVRNRRVMVTGAGGSIGSELVRQILTLSPHALVLAEMSEFALYSIEAEVRSTLQRRETAPIVLPELVDVSDRHAAQRLINAHRPDVIFHAAAYKHVPLVERNPLSAIRNNIFSTMHLAHTARDANVSRFILISTDKAVRPTSLMGATKRVCELILQALADDPKQTCFAMVRFGNVLGSSGSVVPLFKQQIARGGPVTLTHRDVTRFFMTIPEAASLVLQAASMARGGEVFLLDMGESVKIADLARSIIRLSGLTVKDDKHPNGDIEIREIGLRPGEKLHEELLIDADAEPTTHSRIMRAREQKLDWALLERMLTLLDESLDRADAPASIEIVRQLIGQREFVMAG